MSELVDLLVVGGGINGAGIARDAAGRGLRVLLVEKADLAEGTSSRSSKLIHGGLRYLEQREFRLVREALAEREVLLRIAPHIVWPMRFVLPHGGWGRGPGQRPAWVVRLGLYLYDHLAGRATLPGTRRLDLRRAPEGAPLRPEYRTGFAYSDCWVDDARLVVLNALDAAARGAQVRVGTELLDARRAGRGWAATLRDAAGEWDVRARVLVNAAGPWVDQVVQRAGRNAGRRLRLVKGSHIVVRRLWDGPHAYIFQNDDGRVVFAIPYAGEFCLIGTTDTPFDGPPEHVRIDPAERAYLLRAANRFLRTPLAAADIVADYAGIRPLHDDDSSAGASAVSRDYVFDVDAPDGQAPLLSVFGGKITTYRRLAEHALAQLTPFLGASEPWTDKAALPGGDMPAADFEAWLASFHSRHRWLPAPLARHYARLYGTRAERLLDNAGGLDGLGRHFGGLLYAREAVFVRQTEWARTAADVLTRRTKHALHLTAAEQAAFARWWDSLLDPAATPGGVSAHTVGAPP